MIRFVQDILRVAGLPCREHVALLSRQLDTPLSRGEVAGLRLHTLYCGGCRRFTEHLRHLQSLGQTMAEQAENEPGLPADVRARLNDRVGQNTKKN